MYSPYINSLPLYIAPFVQVLTCRLTATPPPWPCIGCVAKSSFLSGGSLFWAFLFSKSGALSCGTEFVLRAGAAAAGNMRGASRACPHRIVGCSGAQEAH